MTAKEFWEDDPALFWSYRISYMQKKKNEQIVQNQMMWLQGAYIYDAVSKAIANSFSKNSKYKYMEKPFDITGEKQIEKQELQARVTTQNSFWSTLKERLERKK